MITAIDTNILIEVLQGNEQSIESMAAAAEAGQLIICEMVYAELCAGLSLKKADNFLLDFRIELLTSSREALALAGQLWRHYLANEGRKGRMIADFLIGAHAQFHAQRLLTQDRGFYHRYFKDLIIFERE